MPRPMWSGTIQISLVGFAVEVYPATSATRQISFHEVDRKTLGRVHRQNILASPSPQSELGEAPGLLEEEEQQPDTSAKYKTSLHIAPKASEQGTVDVAVEDGSQHSVARADIVKGYEYEKGKYAIVEPEELKNLRLAGKKTVEISQFARATEISPALYDKPYFVLPKSGSPATAFSVLRQSMFDSGMVGIGEIVFSGRQHLMTLAPPHDPEQQGMMLYTLRFASEIRDASALFSDVKSVQADAAQLSLAKQLVDAYTQPFDVSKFKDHYEDALRELVESKINHLPMPAPEPKKQPGKVIDLMDALRRSIARRNPSDSSAPGEPLQSAVESETTARSSKPGKGSAPKNVSARSPSRAASNKKRESA